MGHAREFIGVAFGLALLAGAAGASAAPPEPLLVTRLPDPDPNYVPPLEPKLGGRRDDADQNPTIEEAMQDFGRAVGQAGLAIREKVEARCREKIPADLSAEQRFAWEARCSYRRY
jgi:hypothetical protein